MPITIRTTLPVEALNGGLFVARGRGGRHGERVIESHELIFVQQGRLAMFEENDQFVVEEGQALLLEARRRHGGTEAYADNLRFYWVHFKLTEWHATGLNAIQLPQLTTLAEPERLTLLFRRFIDDQESGVGIKAFADATILQMLYEIAQPANLQSSRGTALIPAQRADENIRVNATQPIRARNIAASLGYHPDYLGRIYKQVYGFSLTESINRRRIHEAKLLLLASDSTIDQIASRCGYNDVEYFRRVFRKQEGMPPGAYRRLYARVHVNSE